MANHIQKEFIFPNRVAEIRITYSSKIKDNERPKITSSSDAADVLRSKWNKGRIQYVEEFKVILMNRANRVLGLHNVAIGGLTGCVADLKVIFAAALKANASSIILAHSHPSGNLQPSEADKSITLKMKEAGKFLDLPVLDHIILTKDGYFSFADEGLL